MSKLDHALYEIHSIDQMAVEDGWVNNIHPLIKLIVTIGYVIMVVSFQKYDLAGTISMVIYPAALFIMGDLSLKDSLKRLRVVLPVVCIIGIVNPIFDHKFMGTVMGITITGGMISMITLFMKGIFTVLATYILVATTSIEKICYSLRMLHVPKLFVTQILLIYRYITVLLSEANRLMQAYQLRAPNENGIRFSAWGTVVGQLLLRSIDRADRVYDSMCLRGYTGDFYSGDIDKANKVDYSFLIGWSIVLFALKYIPILSIIGNWFV